MSSFQCFLFIVVIWIGIDQCTKKEKEICLDRTKRGFSWKGFTDYLRTAENLPVTTRNYRPRSSRRSGAFSVWTCRLASSSFAIADGDVVPVALKLDRRAHSSSESDRAGFPSSLEYRPRLQIARTDEFTFRHAAQRTTLSPAEGQSSWSIRVRAEQMRRIISSDVYTSQPTSLDSHTSKVLFIQLSDVILSIRTIRIDFPRRRQLADLLTGGVRSNSCHDDRYDVYWSREKEIGGTLARSVRWKLYHHSEENLVLLLLDRNKNVSKASFDHKQWKRKYEKSGLSRKRTVLIRMNVWIKRTPAYLFRERRGSGAAGGFRV